MKRRMLVLTLVPLFFSSSIAFAADGMKGENSEKRVYRSRSGGSAMISVREVPQDSPQEQSNVRGRLTDDASKIASNPRESETTNPTPRYRSRSGGSAMVPHRVSKSKDRDY